MAEAMKAAFGDLWEMSDEIGNTTSSMCPEVQRSSTKVCAVTSVIAPHLAGTPLDSERMEATKRKHAPRRKQTTPPPLTATHSSTSLASLPQSVFAQPHPSSLASPQTSFIAPIPSSIIAPPLTSLEDPMSYLLETFDTLIAPQIPNPGTTTPSSITLRRCLYRKQYSISKHSSKFNLLRHLSPLLSNSSPSLAHLAPSVASSLSSI